MIALGFELKDADNVLKAADQDHEGSLDRSEFEKLLKQGLGKVEDGCTVVQVCACACLRACGSCPSLSGTPSVCVCSPCLSSSSMRFLDFALLYCKLDEWKYMVLCSSRGVGI